MTGKTARPVPRMGPDDKPFWDYAAKKELRLQRCLDCGRVRFPPSMICDRCLSEKHAWEAMKGTGRVLSWVIFHRQYFPGIPTPYNVILVKLDEGPLFISNLVGVGDRDITFDMPVKVDYIDMAEEFTLPVFRPA